MRAMHIRREGNKVVREGKKVGREGDNVEGE